MHVINISNVIIIAVHIIKHATVSVMHRNIPRDGRATTRFVVIKFKYNIIAFERICNYNL